VPRTTATNSRKRVNELSLERSRKRLGLDVEAEQEGVVGGAAAEGRAARAAAAAAVRVAAAAAAAVAAAAAAAAVAAVVKKSLGGFYDKLGECAVEKPSEKHVFTGGFMYGGDYRYGNESLTHQTLLRDVQAANDHGLRQPDDRGFGVFPVNQNDQVYSAGGLYQAGMVDEFVQQGHPLRVTASIVFDQSCIACGFRLCSATTPLRSVLVCHLAGDLGYPMGGRKRSVVHYCCSLAGIMHYDYVRYQAALVVQGRQRWGVSHNSRDTMSDFVPEIDRGNVRFTLVEVIDLILAVKFATGGDNRALMAKGTGEAAGLVWDWDSVLQYAPILRCSGKTTEDLEGKWFGRASVKGQAEAVMAAGFQWVQ